MEDHRVSQKMETSLHLSEIPDAVKLVQLSGPKAQRIASLALHRNDMNFALECVKAIGRLPEHEMFLRTALWRSAIAHCIKCFGESEARFRLDPSVVYKGRPPAARVSFDFFRSMRNKHFVHDENLFMQCSVGAAINDGSKPKKIERIASIVQTFEVLNPQLLGNLRLLIQHALEWIQRQFDDCATVLERDLEQLPYDKLAKLPPITASVPTAEDADRSR